MRLIKGNVERIAAAKERVARLLADGFTEVPEDFCGGQDASKTDRRTHQGSDDGIQAPDDRIENMGVQELRALAKKRGLGGCTGLSREQLVAVLKENG